MRLLVGFDGSEGGRDALELARTLALAGGGEAVVVFVQPFGPLPVPVSLLTGEEVAEAEPLFSAARERLSSLAVDCRAFGGGSPAEVLTDLAERESFDAIVVGSPHRGAIGRVLIGSVAEGVLHGSPCPVAVAPRGYAGGAHEAFERIAVAYDGSPEAKVALAKAGELAHENRAAVWVLTVVAPPVVMPGPTGYVPAEIPEPERIVAEGVRAIEELAPVEGRRLDGSPAPALAEACGEGVDLLVLGSRGYGPAARVLLGSVSTKLINIAPCPVLTLPRP